MFQIIISNENFSPCPVNYIYQPDILEPMTISFYFDPFHNLIKVLDIHFTSSVFLWNSIKEQIIDKFKNAYISQFQFPIYNRGMFFFGQSDEDKIRYRCIDFACFIAKEYERHYLNSQNIIYYFVNPAKDSVTACVKLSQIDINHFNEPISNQEYYTVGELKTCETEDGLRWLDYCDVDDDFKAQVSKKTMLRLAINFLDLNAIPCVKKSNAYRFYLTDEEEQLIEECLLNGIIYCEMCYFSINSQYRSAHSILVDGILDPGRNSLLLQQRNPMIEIDEIVIDENSLIGSPILN